MFITKALNKGYEADSCAICHAEFTLILRIHKCKRCGSFVCATCGKGRRKHVDETGSLTNKQHRVCALCQQDSAMIEQTIKTYELSWGHSSRFSEMWISKIQGKEYDYDNFLRLFHHNKQLYQDAYETIQKDVMMGRTDLTVFNYSLKEFFYKVQINRTREGTRRSMSNVLCAVTGKYSSSGYCQGMSNIAAFLMCFGTELQAFSMFCDLLDNILPQGFFSKSQRGTNLIGLLAEIYFVKEYFSKFMQQVKNYKMTQDKMDGFYTLIDLIGTKCLLTLFVGNVSFINLFFLWNQMLRRRSFDVILKALIAIMYLFHERAVHGTRQYKMLQRFVEVLDHASFKEVYDQIVIDQKVRKEIIQRYYSNFSNQWNGKDQSTLRKLQRMTKYTKEQIESIQPRYLSFVQQNLMNLSQFLSFIKRYMKQAPIPFLDEYDEEYLGQVYRNFDEGKKGHLDFRQFICCISLLLRSNYKQRLLILGQALQNTEGQIPCKVFSACFQKVIQRMRRVLQFDAQLEELQETFKIKADSLYEFNTTMTFSELYIILNDPFIIEVSSRTQPKKSNDLQLILKCFV